MQPQPPTVSSTAVLTLRLSVPTTGNQDIRAPHLPQQPATAIPTSEGTLSTSTDILAISAKAWKSGQQGTTSAPQNQQLPP